MSAYSHIKMLLGCTFVKAAVGTISLGRLPETAQIGGCPRPLGLLPETFVPLLESIIDNTFPIETRSVGKHFQKTF
jgi:hypothetical protein